MFIKIEDGRIFETDTPEYWGNYQRVTAKVGKSAIKADALETLHGLLKPGQKVQCKVAHVSSSGMSRRINFWCIKDGELHSLDYLISKAIDYKQSDKGGLIVTGCGMDMGHHVVYSLSYAM